MNDILTSHCVSLHSKVSIQNRQIQRLDQEDLDSNELREQVTLCQNEIRNLRYNEQRVLKIISKILRF